ncbi:ATP-binding protein [Shewanella maritima]|uniref:ATP-binding protein n=1 Tax=Shewanella maritima TaxID=2520507 RepID=UPI00373687FF
MKRLFISLYLLLSLSFLGIGWTLDTIWQRQVKDEAEIDAPLIAFALLLSQLPKSERQSYLDTISDQHTIPLQLFNKDQISISGDLTLMPNSIITSQVDESHELQFIAVGDQTLIAGPIDIDPRANLRGVFTILFYLSLALVALVWVWPLSRDLKTLRKATKSFGEANWQTRIELANSSQVAPLASTFNDMANHITSLIDSQKHLTNAISHEIRTPLGRLKFALALLPQYCQPGSDIVKRDEFLEEMKADIKEMENLLQELLTFASLDTAYTEPEFEKCDLIKICEHQVQRVQPLSKILINFDSMQSELFAMCETALIERAIQNLLTNAIRYAQTTVVISVKMVGDEVKLSVTNDGEAIPEEDQPHLFKPFYRSKSQHKGNKGHGLGLAIISRIMERHQGKVSLISNDKHTTFSLQW